MLVGAGTFYFRHRQLCASGHGHAQGGARCRLCPVPYLHLRRPRQPEPEDHAQPRDALGERKAARHALERALDLAEPDGLLFPFLLHPVPELLERHARQRTAHPALIRKIIITLGGTTPAVPAADPAQPLPEPISQAEARVLRLLQTSLSAPEIARELYVSVNTVRTHMRHLYDKLGAHRRLEAINRARALGLLAPVPQRA